MPLTTRCTRCGRQFPVYAQQLKARRGQVDCPHCNERIDAVAGLVDEAGMAGESRLNRGRAAADPGPTTPPRRRAELRETRPGLTAALVPAAVPTSNSRGIRSRTSASPPAPARRPARGRLPWGRLALLLALVVSLGVQLVWWQRPALLRNPTGFQFLTTWCSYLGCRVTPPRLPEALAVREPSLIPDPTTGVPMLRLLIENSAGLPQPAPLIELELYNQQGDLTAARRFSPEEYAAAGAPSAASADPIAPHEVRVVALALAPPPAEAAGFKVRLQ
ncbi:zinc-ribbon and DUF3426 domain-containing protein [uncultured Thiodictyon sp.]|uniref:zinc-ribbon and DUF3426 domain-containing protein n=1 Tax=uncultured Thiodictyon sp. TaxID=1846217 RepID=UPI0025D5730E|nr:zinc-ribbon and DUF3426 domain-containing protein [uncultured Thiodictyon sp.]